MKTEQKNNKIFQYHTDLEDKMKEKKFTQDAKEIEYISKVLLRQEDKIYRNPYNGRRILNVNSDNLWFSDNVAFIFSVGCEFDEDDTELLNTVLSMFNQKNLYVSSKESFSPNGTNLPSRANRHTFDTEMLEPIDSSSGGFHINSSINLGSSSLIDNAEEIALGYFLNQVKIFNYDNSDLVEKIEAHFFIQPGNYHVLMVPIVSTKDTRILDMAPEDRFSSPGLFERFIKWSEIKKFIREMMDRYGFIDELPPKMDPSKLTDKTLKTGNRIKNEMSFDYNTGEVLESVDDTKYDQRIRETGRQREVEGNHQLRDRNKTGGSLLSRIQSDTVVEDTQIDHHQGVEYKYTMIENPNADTFVEYQLFEDPESYDDKSHRNNISKSGDARLEIPIVSSASIRKTGRNKARTSKSFHGIRGGK